MSSNYLSKPIDVKKYGVIYGGVQKNIGPAGMAIVIVRDDLIGAVNPACPTMFDYQLMADNDSMYNTPVLHHVRLRAGVRSYSRWAASRRWRR